MENIDWYDFVVVEKIDLEDEEMKEENQENIQADLAEK